MMRQNYAFYCFSDELQLISYTNSYFVYLHSKLMK